MTVAYGEQQILILLFDGGGVNRVKSRQSRSVPERSPWNQIVHGELEPIAAVPSSPSAASGIV
ncbi:hypothetical protein TIFTF001_032024 [Ficus carica]|uniref:Uncharacterized protein n=1 Tax=Ficus carica TaxID=3494 RepID=A0AA88DW30_FICCA|nr:hypothetical protein TIFTF001_031982 [Ficus carica]GMN62946.1 hypothetical protein TIFTF001_032024 [Ficus carica]